MERHGDEIHLSTDEARAGSTPHIVRYVLGWSLLLTVLILSAIGITYAVSESPSHGWPVTAVEYALGGHTGL